MNTSTLCITGHCLIRDEYVRVNSKLADFVGESDKHNLLVALYRLWGISYPKFFKMDNLSKLGFLAAERLLDEKNMGRYHPSEVSVVFSNAAASADTDRLHQHSIADPGAFFPSPSVFVYTLPNIVMGELAIRHKLMGEQVFFISREFNPVLCHEYVNLVFANGITGACLTGWVEFEHNHVDAAVFLVEKSIPGNNGIANFDADNLHEIYKQG